MAGEAVVRRLPPQGIGAPEKEQDQARPQDPGGAAGRGAGLRAEPRPGPGLEPAARPGPAAQEGRQRDHDGARHQPPEVRRHHPIAVHGEIAAGDAEPDHPQVEGCEPLFRVAPAGNEQQRGGERDQERGVEGDPGEGRRARRRGQRCLGRGRGHGRRPAGAAGPSSPGRMIGGSGGPRRPSQSSQGGVPAAMRVIAGPPGISTRFGPDGRRHST
ncbi:hypothetical protein THSYN_21740 [Candidatus Thiodictyon syntrophicum]|uniref:Uncharacterized protein n=1 Tax=Candidatus Thiodictyon syntrophicum TaxID=1166950 RepID=A0A2K8UCN9_9GAMM|nr:hypothetical protein THSYN_21740 [Candidatus Thiodictyon syntrophicum]